MADESKPVDSGLQQADIAAVAASEKAVQTAVVTPAVAAVTASVEQPGNEAGDDGESAGDDAVQHGETNPGKANTPRGVQKKLDKLTREKYEAQAREQQRAAEVEYWKQQAQQRPQAHPGQAQQPAAQAQSDGKPTLESCGNDPEKYLETLAEWKADQRITAHERQVAEQAKFQEANKTQLAFLGRLKEYEAAVPGAEKTALEARINYSPAMVDYVFTSENGPQLAVYLAQHLDEAKAIEALPPLRQGIALDRIERTFAAAPAVSTEAPARQVTQAPRPPATVAPSGTARRNIYDDGLTTAERIAMWRRKKSA